MRLLSTALGTVWVVACIVAYLAYGRIFEPNAAMYWYGLGWLLAGAVAATPFFIYWFTGDHHDNPFD